MLVANAAACLVILVAGASPVASQATRSEDPLADARLEVLVSIRAPRQSVNAIIADLKKQSVVLLVADPSVAEDRLILFARRRPLAEIMRVIARLNRWQWERELREGEGSPCFRLLKAPSTALREAREQNAWLQKKAALEAGRQDMVARLIEKGIALGELSQEERELATRGDPWLTGASRDQGDALFGLLGELSPEQRSALAEASLRSAGPIPANDQSHIERLTCFATPVTALPESLQQTIIQHAVRQGAQGELQGATVGLAALNGSIGLTVKLGSEVFWSGFGLGSPPFPEIYDTTLREYEAWKRTGEIRFTDHTQFLDALSRQYDGEITDRSGLPDVRIAGSLRKRLLDFRAIRDRAMLAPFLAAVHDQTGLIVIADGLQRSSQVNHAWTLNENRSYTLREALETLSFMFLRSVLSDGSALVLRTRKYSIARLFEIPDSLLQKWMSKRKKQNGLSFQDCAALALELTPEQLETLEELSRETNGLQKEGSVIRRFLPAFRLWNSLDAPERQLLSAGGIALKALSPSQRRDFWRIAALAGPSDSGIRIPGGGLHLQRAQGRVKLTVDMGRPNYPLGELRIPISAPE